MDRPVVTGFREFTRNESQTVPGNSTIILMYHHVAEALSDPSVLSVSPQHFAEHLDVLQHEVSRAGACVLRLTQLVGHLHAGNLPPRSAVITFDDGYTDNLLNAKPLLERHDMPATVFVTTGTDNSASEFWWDELERLLLLPGALPEVLELQVGGDTLRCRLEGAATYKEEQCLRLRGWRVWEDPPTPRHSLYASLCPLLKPLSHHHQQSVMEQLRRWAGAAVHRSPIHRRLTAAEIASLSEGGLVEIGAHTVSHPMLSTLARARQREEMRECKSALEDIVGSRVSGFAYPYGDYSSDSPAIAREVGFEVACSTIMGGVQPDSDPFELPRRHVWDWGGDEFTEWLRRMWMNP